MSETQPFHVVVLAAGEGTRMRSTRPKVLHEVMERPLVSWPIQAALDAGAQGCVVVVAPKHDQVRSMLRERFESSVRTAVQPEPKGTGHAVQCGLEALQSCEGSIVILYGDCPLIRPEVLQQLVVHVSQQTPVALVTAKLEDPFGYGRILRNEQGEVVAIREERDCSAKERTNKEVNPGVYAIDASFLRKAVASLSTDNAQGELYLTDVVAQAASEAGVASVQGDMKELRGVNDRYELAQAEELMRLRVNEQWARQGVTFRDLHSTWVGPGVELQPDVVLERAVVLRGACSIASGARIDVGSVLTDVQVDRDVYIKPYSVAQQSHIGPSAQVGPFAHLRSGSELAAETRVGNFVETKKTKLGRGSKANHLAYLGDGDLGENVNVGAGVIFCNYDGFQKHVTTIADGAFVGSDCQIVAPVTIGGQAYVATGTTVTRDVPAEALAVGRVRQENKEGYARKLRARLKK